MCSHTCTNNKVAKELEAGLVAACVACRRVAGAAITENHGKQQGNRHELGAEKKNCRFAELPEEEKKNTLLSEKKRGTARQRAAGTENIQHWCTKVT